ncbi:hypothetical protein LINPERHAP2_LOCUS30363 [Linum perenne]
MNSQCPHAALPVPLSGSCLHYLHQRLCGLWQTSWARRIESMERICSWKCIFSSGTCKLHMKSLIVARDDSSQLSLPWEIHIHKRPVLFGSLLITI